MLCRRYPLRATRLAADAVSPNVVLFVYYTLRATASRPSPILAARDYVSPVADAVPMPVLLHAWRARVMCTCGRCLAFSPNVIMIPFVFKRVHKHATSHHPVQMFLQACCIDCNAMIKLHKQRLKKSCDTNWRRMYDVHLHVTPEVSHVMHGNPCNASCNAREPMHYTGA